MEATQILRGFNRAYTQRIGVLSDSYLGTGRPLGTSRLLFEISPAGSGVIELRRLLDLDSGYMSRLLRRLESEGLVTVEDDPNDRRRRVVRPTTNGNRAKRALEVRSQKLATDLIEPLTPRLREELASALTSAERILRAATVRFSPVSLGSEAAQTSLGRYFAELDERFDGGFDLARGGASTDADLMTPPNGVFLVIRNDNVVIGCGGVQRVDEETAEIKRMWVDRDWRGLGLGTRLLTHLEHEAAELGWKRVVLDTNGALTEAIAMYDKAGYRRIGRYNDNPYAQHWFEKALFP